MRPRKFQMYLSITLILGILLLSIGGKLLQNELNDFNFSIEVSSSIVDVEEPTTFQITVLKGVISQFIVDFHDGTPTLTIDGTNTEIQHIFAIEGEYLVSVVGVKVIGDLGRVLTLLKVISVTVQNETPVVEIDVEKSEVWEDESIQFEVGSIDDSAHDLPLMQYKWLLGDGQSYNGSSIIHTYPEAGTYEVTLYAIDDQGLIGMNSQTILVKNVIPEPVLKINTTEITEDQVILFDAQQTTDSPSDIGSLQFGWDFGDGTFNYGPIVTHKYCDEGNYEITLSVKDQYGGEKELSAIIKVKNTPPEWKEIELNDNLLPEGQTLIIHSQGLDTPSDQPRVTYNWFCENKIGQTNTWTYFDEQELHLTGTIMDDNGLNATSTVSTLYYNVPPKTSLVGSTITFNLTLLITGEKWHDAELTLYDEMNNICLNDIIYRDVGDPLDQALFFYDVTLDLTRLWRIEIICTPENDPVNGQPLGANPVDLYFNFSDGSSRLFEYTFNYNFPEDYLWCLPLQPFTNGFPIDLHINYYDPGQDDLTITIDHLSKQTNVSIPAPIYGPNQGVIILPQIFEPNNTMDYFSLFLKIIDEDGASSNFTYLYEAPFGVSEGYQLKDLAPRINLLRSNINTTLGYAWEDTPIEFNATISSSIPQTISYYWTFGDGTNLTTTTPEISYTFVTEGLYNVELVVKGQNYSTTQSLVIEICNIRPTAFVEKAFGQTIEVGTPLIFNATASFDNPSDLDYLRFVWDFGDGDTTSGYSSLVTHSYFYSGVYRGCLTIFDDNGDNGTIEFVVWVNNPAPEIELADQIQMKEGETTVLEAQISESAFQMPYLDYEWHIDGFTTFQSRINIILDDGAYFGNLTVRDIEGRETSKSFQIIVNNQLPQVMITPHLVYGQKIHSYQIFASAIDNNIDYQSLYYRFTITNSMSPTSELLENQEWSPVTKGKIIIELDLSTLAHGQHILVCQVKDPTGIGPTQQQPLVVYWDEDGDNLSDILEAQMGTDETLADTDNDWIIDSQEESYGTNPTLFDTDEDGLWDGYQTSTGLGEFLVNTDPTDPDTDDDSLIDGIEVFGWNITVLMQGSSTSYNEIQVYSNPLLKDTDNDGLTDAQEYQLKSNPQASDTDNDQLTDLEEFTHGTPLTSGYSRTTTIKASLSIDDEAAGETAPWIAEITVTEAFKNDPLMQLDRNNNGDLIPTTYSVSLYYYSVGEGWKQFGSCPLDDSGKGIFAYNEYYSSIHISFPATALYDSTGTFVSPKYHVDEMIQNIGPEDTDYIESDAFANAKWKIYRAYIEESGAFVKISDTYYWLFDKTHTWKDEPPGTGYSLTRGYQIVDWDITFTEDELESQTFNTDFITFRRFHGYIDIGGEHPEVTDYYYTKPQILDLWLSMKIQPWRLTECPAPYNIKRYINDAASDLVSLLNYDQEDYQSQQNNNAFQASVASIHGRLYKLTHTGFPQAQGFFESILQWLQNLIEELISFVQGIIKALADLAVGAIKFLFYVWDDLVKPALGSVVTLIKEVAKFTIKIILSIMTKALTGEQGANILGPYQAYVKNIIIQTVTQFNIIDLLNGVENALDTSYLTELSDKLSTNIQSLLGPFDNVLEIFNFVQETMNFPGIIKDLTDLIGPALVYTILLELFQEVISLAFKALSETWTQSQINSFLKVTSVDTFLDQIRAEFIDMTNSNFPTFQAVTTVSGLIQQVGKFTNLISSSMLTNLLNIIISDLQTAILNDIILTSIIDLIAVLIGGFLYLLSPTMNFSSFSADLALPGQCSNSIDQIHSAQSHPFVEKIADIAIFFFMSVVSRILISFSDTAVINLETKLLFKKIALVFTIANLEYTAGFEAPFFEKLNIENDPGYITAKYGAQFGYLGSNVISSCLNILGEFLEISILSFTSQNPTKPFPQANLIHLIASAFKTYASFITILAASFWGAHSAIVHFSSDKIIFIGDCAFIFQAGIKNFILNIDELQLSIKKAQSANPNSIKYGFFDWNSLPATNTYIKKANFFLNLDIGLDLIMTTVFLIY